MPADPAGARHYASYIASQIEREDDRGKSVESRGITVVTSSGTLATLLLGLVAIATKAQTTFTLPNDARLPLALAVVAFAVAALTALGTNVPRGSEEASFDGLETLVSASWNDDEATALATVAENQISIARDSRQTVNQKAWALIGAMFFEAAAVALLAWAMLEIV